VPDFRVLAIPPPYWLNFIKHPWAFDSKYDITDILSQVTPVPIITVKPKLGYTKGSEIINLAYSAISNNSGQKILELICVKYILVRHDVFNDQFNYNTSLSNIYTLEKSMGKLEFFKNPTYIPIISAVSNALPIWGRVDALLPLTYVKELNLNSTAFFFINNMNLNEKSFLLNSSKRILLYDREVDDKKLLKILENNDIDIYYLFNSLFPNSIKVIRDGLYNITTIDTTTLNKNSSIIKLSKGSNFLLPQEHVRTKNMISILSPINSSLADVNKIKLESRKINDIHYKIDVYSEVPFFIIFNMLYNPKWNAVLDGQKLRHLETNSYANCYYVPNNGRFLIELMYPGNNLSIIGAYISFIFLIIMLIYVTGVHRRYNIFTRIGSE